MKHQVTLDLRTEVNFKFHAGQARDVLVLNDNIVLLCDHTALLIVNITNIQNITEISRITPDIGIKKIYE